jgi:hypothetical protein
MRRGGEGEGEGWAGGIAGEAAAATVDGQTGKSGDAMKYCTSGIGYSA